MKRLMMVAAAMLLGSSGAWALGTTAGTTITNGATLSYKAGGVDQPDVDTQQDDSFVVDKKIDMVLQTTDGDQIEVKPGQTERITSYVLTNEGNDVQNFRFTVDNLDTNSPNNGEADYNTEVDNENVLNMVIEYDNNGNWEAIPATGLSLSADDTVNLRVKADIPADDGNQPNDLNDGKDGDVMNIELVAIAIDANGADEQQTDPNQDDTQGGPVDIVFADGSTVQNNSDSQGLGESYPAEIPGHAGTADGHKGDNDKDGKEAARSGYKIKTPVLSLGKTSCVISDPVNNENHPKRIPGAIIRYMFDIENSGSDDASDITIMDDNINSALLLANTAPSAKKVESQDSACTCSNVQNAADIENDTSVDAPNHTVTINHLNVEAPPANEERHTCVSFEVEID